MNFRNEAVQWIPLFPAKEIPFILAAVLRCSANLRKRSTTERETKMKKMWADAVAGGADLIAFPELAICGYPPEDLVYKKQFVKDDRPGAGGVGRGLPGTRRAWWVSWSALRAGCTTPPR